MDSNDRAVHQLHEQGFITDTQLADITAYKARGLFSLQLELRMLLYFGILAFTGGLGVLVYEHIDTIGHAAIISLIGILCAGCFVWSFRNNPGFSKGEVNSANPFFDYVVLAANLLAGIFCGYIQYQYKPFGNHNSAAILVPTAMYFSSAYYFDHRGVLSLGITGLAAWLGINASPTNLFLHGFEQSVSLDLSSVLLAAALVLTTIASARFEMKKHFNFTYLNFAMHLLFIGAIAGLVSMEGFNIFIVPIGLGTWYFLRLAYKRHAFNFLVFTALYANTALTYLVFQLLDKAGGVSAAVLSTYYVVISCAGIIFWLYNFKRTVE
jgi:hypothetical protein